jgi:hypothetical protein
MNRVKLRDIPIAWLPRLVPIHCLSFRRSSNKIKIKKFIKIAYFLYISIFIIILAAVSSEKLLMK